MFSHPAFFRSIMEIHGVSIFSDQPNWNMFCILFPSLLWPFSVRSTIGWSPLSVSSYILSTARAGTPQPPTAHEFMIIPKQFMMFTHGHFKAPWLIRVYTILMSFVHSTQIAVHAPQICSFCIFHPSLNGFESSRKCMETDHNFPFRHAMFCTFQAQHQKSMPCVWLPLKLLRFLLYSGMLWPMCKLDHLDQIGLAV